ncbi:MAG: DUF4276 family protein [Planctomycetes bacterium]|nr:DUF4276 family protein [Planctomycetota bacterium]
MSEIVFLLEEPSAEAMLRGFLPRILPDDLVCRFVVFDGKQDMEKQMARRIRGYRVPGARFVVLRDQDSADCKSVKRGLVQKCEEAGRPGVLVRMACHELESWYLADLAAVEEGLGLRGLAKMQQKRPYARPDGQPKPSDTLARIAPSYQKVSGSRAIGPHLDPENDRSRSFLNFVAGLRRLTGCSPKKKSS